MRVHLFLPCYVDQLFPQVAWATVELLERHGASVVFLPDQTCCGQMHLGAGDRVRAARLARRLSELFADAEHVVAPSASCVAMVRRQYRGLLEAGTRLDAIESRTRELCEFLVEVAGVQGIEGSFPHRVGLHPSCHGLRELRLGSSSELCERRSDPARRLLSSLRGLELVQPDRPDECCGFGGVFSVLEADLSCLMGRDRLHAHRQAGAEFVTATDVSCLAHLEGLIRRHDLPIRTLHVAEILAGAS